MQNSGDKAATVVAMISVALFVPLVIGIAVFTDAFSSPMVLDIFFMGAGGSAGFGVAYLLTLSRRWRRLVAGLIVLVCGLFFAGWLWLAWTFFGQPSMPGWMDWLDRNPQFIPPAQLVVGAVGGALSTAFSRFSRKTGQDQSRKREAQAALLAIGAGLAIALVAFTLSGA